MADLLLLIDGLMKIALVVGVMVLVATAPSGASAAAAGHGNYRHDGARSGLVSAAAAHRDDGGSMRYAFEDDDTFAGHSALDQTNVISTGAHDHGADHWRHDSDHESHRSSLIEADPFEHSFNTDGTPMFGSDFDIHGNTYGVTDWQVTDWHGNDSWGGGTSSMFD